MLTIIKGLNTPKPRSNPRGTLSNAKKMRARRAPLTKNKKRPNRPLNFFEVMDKITAITHREFHIGQGVWGNELAMRVNSR